MALGTSAYALDNIKVDGEAKLWYQTSEYSGAGATAAQLTQDFFDKTANSMALGALKFGASAGLADNLSGAVKVTAISTLGLENNMVGAIPAAKIDIDTGAAATGALNDQAWVEVLNLKYATKDFDVAMGRMALQTPLCFTESWNVVDNTFEAVVAHGYFLPDTILAAAWVGKHNGAGLLSTTSRGSTVNYNGEFRDFAVNGAYAAAVINKSLPGTTLQAWYYNVPDVADAYWLQADAKVMGMVDFGVQVAGMNPDNSSATIGTPASTTTNRTTDAFSVKAAADVGPVNVYAAYSTVSDGSIGFANVATGDKSMLYTTLGSIYMDGEIVAAPDTDAWKIGASTKAVPGVTLAASYCSAETGDNGGTATAVGGASTRNTDFSAWDVSANTKVGPVGLTAIYTQYEIDGAGNAGDGSAADKDTDTIRIIASLKF
ncbi:MULTISPECIES: hypothetical protein [unclassified Sulfuricurvum]|uniref:hypothetical protein n=1 Tax=unclassified Sulfuricurvum TaxID=2632390 RepID=UPI0008BAB946|nr:MULTISPECIES: hypothetical protein [unclassified Sulfuricurvum]OHD88726.1 MAG: hypothetical protein A3G19_09120 [Sulfuricurvum sp. RIFCSPLOWO2_12_FULL_43_24]